MVNAPIDWCVKRRKEKERSDSEHRCLSKMMNANMQILALQMIMLVVLVQIIRSFCSMDRKIFQKRKLSTSKSEPISQPGSLPRMAGSVWHMKTALTMTLQCLNTINVKLIHRKGASQSLQVIKCSTLLLLLNSG